jgi:hypothetical protein
MGIENIHILIEPDVAVQYSPTPVTQAQSLAQALVYAHRRGEHPVGQMVRACPLCQRS